MYPTAQETRNLRVDFKDEDEDCEMTKKHLPLIMAQIKSEAPKTYTTEYTFPPGDYTSEKLLLQLKKLGYCTYEREYRDYGSPSKDQTALSIEWGPRCDSIVGRWMFYLEHRFVRG